MFFWFVILFVLYMFLLIFSAIIAKKNNKDDKKEILFAKGGISTFLLFISFSATLFSTFTIMGIPDFFRQHGVGTWAFIAIPDIFMGFIVLIFGLKLKDIMSKEKVFTISALLKRKYKSNLSVFVYLIGIFIFLTPYVAIQIQGVSSLLPKTFVYVNIESWEWAVIILFVMIIYSWIGGLRAIMYSDVFQGIILLAVIWIIAINIIESVDGLSNLFEELKTNNKDLLSLPGPNGLMNFQFLLSTFIAIILMPVTQPQLSSRIVAAKNIKEIPLMALGISTFAILTLLPAAAIGLAGSILYPNIGTIEFLSKVLVENQTGIVGAFALIGLFAAAMSTADSQLYAIGSESQSINADGDKEYSIFRTKVVIIVFALISFLLAYYSNQQIVLLARISFIGTSLLAPMIVIGLFKQEEKSYLPLITLIALIVFLLMNFGFFPKQILNVHTYFYLLGGEIVYATIEYLVFNKKYRREEMA